MAPAGKTPETGTGPCGGIAISPLQSSGAQERCPSGHTKGDATWTAYTLRRATSRSL